VLVKVGFLTQKSEQKKVTTNMVTLKFGDFPKVVVQDGLTPIPKGKMKVTNPLAEEQKAKGLIPLTTKSREIMWVHPNIVNDKQWDSTQPKLKDKSCNVVSLL